MSAWIYLAAAQPLLKDVATILFDTALRPEELFRLSKEGKGTGSKRRVPATDRVKAILNERAKLEGPWFFPADTKEKHIGHSSIKKQHNDAIRDAIAKKDSPLKTRFVIYSIRHTRARVGWTG